MSNPLPTARPVFLVCALLLAWLAGAGAQGGSLFPNPTVIRTGNWPAAVYTADVNADGIPDLISIDHGAAPGKPALTRVLLGDGQGHFTQSAVLATIGDSVALGDFDGDGKLDLGWTQVSGSTIQGWFAPGRGDGSFAVAKLYATINPVPTATLKPPVLTGAVAVHFADSGPPYLLVEDSANQYLWFLGDSFLQGEYLYNGLGAVFTADLNGDGHADLIVQGAAGYTAAVLGDGKGYMLTPVNSSAGRYFFYGAGSIHSILVQDVNHDGRPDLIAEGTNGRIEVYPGNGDGTFQTTSIGGTGTLDGRTGNGGHLIALADLNGDGQLDALTSTPIGVSALLGQGTAYLGLKGIFNAGPGMHSFATADFNGDGYLDLATDSPEGIAILYGKGDGTFQTSRAYAAGAPAMSGTVGVFTGSGHTDALVSTGATQSQLLLGAGDGTFAALGGAASPTPTTPSAGPTGLWSGVLAADLDGDGKLDLVITADGASSAASGGTPVPTTGDGALFQLGNGDGTFQPLSPFPDAASLGPSRLYGVSTLQYPGVPGIARSSYIANLGQQGNNLISGTGLPGDLYPASHPESDPHAHNLVLEGLLRPAPAVNQRGHYLLIEDEGSLLLEMPNASSSGAFFGDLHQDGSMTTPGQMVAPDISPTFPGPSKALGFNAFPGSGVIADLDGDGNGDVVMLYANLDADRTAPTAAAPNYLYLWFGSNGNTAPYGPSGFNFGVSAAHPTNPVRMQLSRNYYQVVAADVTGDGIPDLVLSDGYILAVMPGIGDGTFGPEQHFLAGQGINAISTADLRGTGHQDLVVANGGTVFGNVVANREVLTPNPDVSTGGVTVLLNLPQATSLPAPAGKLAASPEPSTFESAVTLTATLTDTGTSTPTGTVTFLIDGVSAGSAPVAGGAATLPLLAPYPAYLGGQAALRPGTHTLTASYSGDASYAAASLSGAHIVLLGPTAVTLTPTTPLSVSYGQAVNGLFSISVVDSVYYPDTGTYTLYDNGVAPAVCTALPITAECPYGQPILLDAGVHTFTVGYNGDPVNAGSLSAPVVYTVQPDVTVVGPLTSTQNPSTVGQSVTFSAQFLSNVLPPVGTVQFLDGTVPLGTGSLSNGVATFTTANLTVGTHHITAVYAATLDFTAATSAVLNQVVLPATSAPAAAFTLVVTPPSLRLGVGRTGVFTATVTGALATTLSCSATFTEASCSPADVLLPAGGGSTQLLLATAAPHDCGDPTHPYFVGPESRLGLPPGPFRAGAWLAATALCGLVWCGRRRQTLPRLLTLLLASALALSGLSGCGHCTDLGTRPGNYSFTVTATASDGTSQTVTVPIQSVIPGE